VNRLPPEVITSCAALVSDGDPRLTVPLTHVCRYWHNAITSNPRNWKSIGTGWTQLVPLCLERAGTVPLVVDIVVPDGERDENFLKALLPNIPRAGSLRLTGYSSVESLADDLPGFFDSPIPNLVSLELHRSAAPAQPFPSNEIPVPPVFRNVRTLKSLHLTQTPIYPALFNIASLIELKLDGYTSPFEFGTFVGFLRSNLDLEHVVLNVQFVVGSVETAPAGKVTLSRLRHISITCSKAIDSRGLLSCISLPRGAHIEVISTHSEQFAKLGSFLPSPPTPILELLAPIVTAKTQITPQEFHLFGTDSVFTFRSAQFLLNGFLELGLFPTTAIREFHTDVRPHIYTVVRFSGLMKQLPSLEIFAISQTMLPVGLLSALTEEPVLCPALKTIAFLGCNIDLAIIKQLGDAIVKRRDSPAAWLHRIVIVNKTGTDFTAIQQLRKYVPCVEVRVDDKLPDLS